MNAPAAAPTSHLCRYTSDTIFYRDSDLVRDLLGKAGFVEVFVAQMLGRRLEPRQMVLVEAILVALMEHGLTPSAISARLIYASSPENLQAGVAAGLLAVGSQFVGTMEEAAGLLERIVASPDRAMTARTIAMDHRARRAPLPGFGHHLHKPDDPRAVMLLDMASEHEVAGEYCEALKLLGREVDAATGRHITINTTGAIAGILGDLGIPKRLMRGFAVLSRAAGLLAHLAEEQQEPSGRYIW